MQSKSGISLEGCGAAQLEASAASWMEPGPHLDQPATWLPPGYLPCSSSSYLISGAGLAMCKAHTVPLLHWQASRGMYPRGSNLQEVSEENPLLPAGGCWGHVGAEGASMQRMSVLPLQ